MSVDRNLAASPAPRITLAITIALVAIVFACDAGTTRAATNDIPVHFAWDPPSPTPGQVVTFTASASPPDGVEVKGYQWDLNGDGKLDTRGESVTWSYPAPGPVDVRVRVKAGGKHRGEAVRTVSVLDPGPGTPAPPVAGFTITPSSPVANQPVLFTSTSGDPDGTLVEQVWDLNGDGSYDNGGGAMALRTFTDAGEHVIGLRVTDDAGLVSFASQTVAVLPAPGSLLTIQQAGLRPLSPFPIVRIAGRVTRRGTRVRLLRVTAPVGAQVSIRCSGRACPFRKHVRTVSTTSSSSRTVSFRVRRLERLVRPGVRVRVYITKRDTIGKYTRFRFRRGKAPARTDSCVLPESSAPVECPGS
jgi:PKD repeat protein